MENTKKDIRAYFYTGLSNLVKPSFRGKCHKFNSLEEGLEFYNNLKRPINKQVVFIEYFESFNSKIIHILELKK